MEKNGCSVREGVVRREVLRRKKKSSAGEREERNDETGEKERGLVGREKADTADVAGERNAAAV